jgi:predicted dehydrogenase
MEIIGSEGTLSVPSPFKPGLNEKIIFYSQEKTENIDVPTQELYAGEVEDMADCILNNKEPRIPLSDSRANIAAIVALLESARTNKPVAL